MTADSEQTQYDWPEGGFGSLYEALAEVGEQLTWRVSPTSSLTYVATLAAGFITIGPSANRTIEIRVHDAHGRLLLMEAAHQHDGTLRGVYETASTKALDALQALRKIADELEMFQSADHTEKDEFPT